MSKKVTVRALALLAGGALCITALPLSACKGGSDSIVVMAEEFSGLFNPFYATSGSDMEVVGMTQLSMLTTDGNGALVAGDDQATAVKAFDITYDAGGNAVYTFVLKNGLKFSDGNPLTMNDVMFNIYEYLDPVYTGSSTMYSVKIQGLTKYRTQQDLDNNQSDTAQNQDNLDANSRADTRRKELVSVFKQERFRVGGGNSNSYSAPYEDMKDAIAEWNVQPGYKNAVVMEPDDTDYNAKLLEDYEFVRTTLKKELNSDFNAAKESFDLNTEPYKTHKDKFENDIFKFFFYEGYIVPKYKDVSGKKDKTVIESFEYNVDLESFNTQEQAVDKIFNDEITDELDSVLSYRGTAGDVLTQFSAEAREVILNGRRKEGKLAYPRVDGIVSLGHKVGGTTYALGSQTAVTVDGKSYNIAFEHNADGTPSVADTYDILRIKLDGKDPKAKYNFSFSVAPAHYYSNVPVNIENDQYGVDYASASFQGKVIQSSRNVSVPVGAGPYKATNSANDDDPAGNEFWSNNYIYYKRNEHFMFEVKTEKFQYQYVSSSNALDKLKAREIDFVTPQFTKENSETLKEMEKDGFKALYAWQLGYGYIGINAGKVKNINLRKAIMSAMQASLATEYYQQGTCEVIDWPMSNQSWAYPTNKANGQDYLQWTGKEEAKTKINRYTSDAKAAGATKLNYKFTIAGASITEHPTYNVFKQAAELLNECGWDVEVKADSQALTKLSTGSLEVWAAAWGSTIDPDMYQVYHKNSTATSVYAWGYREILADQGTYGKEYSIITQLSKLIDDARAIEDQEKRKEIYEDAMDLVLQLAVEMPVYQRQNVYAYNAKKLGGINENVNPFTSPLEKVWNLEIL